jgi:hypothetical protein
MSPLTREAIQRVLGPVDNALAAELAATGASEEELAEAHAWVNSDEALMSDLRPLPKGRVAQLVDILVQIEGPAAEDD